MEICTVGGFEEVGKNMTAVKVGEDVFLFDAGLYLPGVIELQDSLEENSYNEKNLRRVGGIPNDKVLDELGWSSKVRAIFISHAHLDHIGGAPYIAHRYPNAPIFGTPFTMEVLRSLLEDEKLTLPNQMKRVEFKKQYSIPNSNKNIKVEFIHTTHSTLDCSFVVLHTLEGRFFYALDYKFDDNPTMGELTDYESLKRIGKQGVKIAIINTLYAGKDASNGTETDADRMLAETFAKVSKSKGALFITTFSSHIERINNIVKHAKKTGREIVFLGRSLNKYVYAARNIGKCPFYEDITILKYKRQVDSFLRQLEKDPSRYIVVCTGHQGEKNSILDRISKGLTPFQFSQEDNLIFSSSVIPTEVNIEARSKLDKKLEKQGVHLYKDIHVHGHGSKASKIKLIQMIKSEHLIPAHGSLEQEQALIDVAREQGYAYGKTSHLAKNGQVFTFQ
jgi:ribonuclease J